MASFLSLSSRLRAESEIARAQARTNAEHEENDANTAEERAVASLSMMSEGVRAHLTVSDSTDLPRAHLEYHDQQPIPHPAHVPPYAAAASSLFNTPLFSTSATSLHYPVHTTSTNSTTPGGPKPKQKKQKTPTVHIPPLPLAQSASLPLVPASVQIQAPSTQQQERMEPAKIVTAAKPLDSLSASVATNDWRDKAVALLQAVCALLHVREVVNSGQEVRHFIRVSHNVRHYMPGPREQQRAHVS